MRHDGGANAQSQEPKQKVGKLKADSAAEQAESKSNIEAPKTKPDESNKPPRKSRSRKPRFKGKTEESPETSPSPPPTPTPSSGPPPDPKPKFKAEFFIHLKVDNVGKKRAPLRVVGDTGCSRSAMSEEFFLSCPHLKTRPYRPLTSRGTAINGTKVLTLGLVNVAFRINGRFYSNNFRVIRGLVQDVFLGWDWFCSSGAMINPDNGTLDFPRQGDSIPLVKSWGLRK